MADFIPTKGFDNCPKCGGWQMLDKTTRKPNGWPIGPLLFVDCDNCHGKGEVRSFAPVTAWPEPPESAWTIPPPQRRQRVVPIAPEAVVIEDGVAMPEDEPEALTPISAWPCRHAETLNVWGKLKCADCGADL